MTSLNFQIVPTTEAPAQRIQTTLGGQAVTIDLYTKSVNVPVVPPGSIEPSDIPMGSFLGVIAGNVLTVGSVAAGGIPPGVVIIRGPGVLYPTYVSRFGTGVGGVGTYIVTPSQDVGPVGMYAVAPAAPTYENTNPVFLDLYVNDTTLIVGGVPCLNDVRIVRDTYLGFIGDLSVIDTEGNDDPQGVPLRLPLPPLRNVWQRNLPLSLAGKAPPNLANRIPGLGSRFLLTYWPNLP
jgi:hypothetical protein